MNVKLVSITESFVKNEDGTPLTPEELLVYIARVSNPSNQMNTETSDKLLGFLIRSKHWSPFDMVNLTVEVTTSRVVAHQILRHWSIKPQEFSQRYAEVVDFEPIELRMQAEKNRQSSVDVFNPIISYVEDWTQRTYEGDANSIISSYVRTAENLYRALLEAKVAKESARFILPLTTSTTMYLNGSIRSWIFYLEQRTDLHAQKEHRLVANEIKGIFMQHFPNIAKALDL